VVRVGKIALRDCLRRTSRRFASWNGATGGRDDDRDVTVT
jgi:hypothetical protein